MEELNSIYLGVRDLTAGSETVRAFPTWRHLSTGESIRRTGSPNKA